MAADLRAPDVGHDVDDERKITITQPKPVTPRTGCVAEGPRQGRPRRKMKPISTTRTSDRRRCSSGRRRAERNIAKRATPTAAIMTRHPHMDGETKRIDGVRPGASGIHCASTTAQRNSVRNESAGRSMSPQRRSGRKGSTAPGTARTCALSTSAYTVVSIGVSATASSSPNGPTTALSPAYS